MDLLISASALNESLGVQLFTLFYCGDDLAPSLPGALHLDWRGDPGRILAYVEQLGLRKDAKIVCFTRWGLEDAARVWWVLAKHGFTHVHVLNGGVKSWTRLGLKLAGSPTKLPELLLAKPIESEFMLVFEQEAPANSLTLDTTQDSLRFMNLLTKDAGLVHPHEIRAKLAYFDLDMHLLVTGDLVGTLLLALTIAGYTKVYWLGYLKSQLSKGNSVCKELQSNTSEVFEVVEVAPRRLSYASTASRPRLQRSKHSSRREEDKKEVCFRCFVF